MRENQILQLIINNINGYFKIILLISLKLHNTSQMLPQPGFIYYYSAIYTVHGPLYKCTPEMMKPPLIRTPSMVPATYVHKTTPEMRTLLIRTPSMVPATYMHKTTPEMRTLLIRTP